MTKRFFIGYSLITFFLLNSVVLLAQHKASFVQQWKIEDASHALQIIERADTLELIVPDGLTMWYRQRLTGDYEISYRICMVMQGGKYDRLSDLNCFWAANDPKYSDDLFARSQWRDGIFKNYNTLNLFYVGYGGNDNSTTRFRRYKGEYYGVADDKVKPLLKEYTNASHLLVPNQWYEKNCSAMFLQAAKVTDTSVYVFCRITYSLQILKRLYFDLYTENLIRLYFHDETTFY